ncbi:MAG: SDR family oxidoreductase [Blastocatellia bacterium]|nr:SDR family oxidoreductase [Blastocatellia bacterium]
MELNGKVALVTGGALRLGRAIALALAKEGVFVVVHYNRSEAAALETAAQVKSLGVGSKAIRADLRSKMQIDELVRLSLEEFSRVDILVNNAAIYYKTPVEEFMVKQWDEIMDVNLRAPVLCAIEFGRRMKEQGFGKIINIADWSAERPYADYLSYCVSKAALIAATKSLAKALAPEVQVNAISPGAVLMAEECTEESRRLAAEHTLTKHLGDPSDVAKAVVFLASSSDFITGTNIVIDGGRLIYGI